MAYSARKSAYTDKTARAIVPTIPYRDAMAMAEWLCAAYGFEKRRAVTSENDEFRYTQLAFGEHVVTVVRAQEPTLERLVVHPDQTGGVGTQACYLVVADIEAHYARATANGAEIIFGIEGQDGGDRRYASRDPEGHIWMFGTYNPYEGRYPAKSSHPPHNRGNWPRAPLAALASALSIAAIAAGVWVYADKLAALKTDASRFATAERSVPEGTEVDARRFADELQQVRAAKASAERNLSQTRAALEAATRAERQARDTLAQEMRARDGFARTATQVEDQLRQERTARSTAERVARDATDQLSRAQVAKGTAERHAKEMTERLELERRARALAEQSAQSATAELARERSAKAAAELAAAELRNQIAAIVPAPQGIQALRDQFETERRARERLENAAKDARLQLAQEKFSRDATERALKQVQDRLEQTQDRLAAASCWACPTGAPCAKP